MISLCLTKKHAKNISLIVIFLIIQLIFSSEFVFLKVNNVNHVHATEYILFSEPVAAVVYDETYVLNEKTYFELFNPIDAPPNVTQMLSVNFTEEYEFTGTPKIHPLPKMNELLNSSGREWYFSGLAYQKPFFWTLEWREVTVDLDQQVLCFSLESPHFSNHTLSTPYLNTSKLETFFRKDIEFGKQYFWVLEWYTLKDAPEEKRYNISAYSPITYQRVKSFEFSYHADSVEPDKLSYDEKERIWVDIGTSGIYCVAFSLTGQKLGKIVNDRFWRVPYNYERRSQCIVEQHVMLFRLQQRIFRDAELSNIAGFQIHFLKRKPVSLPIFVAEVSSIVVVLAWVGYTIYGKYKKKNS